MSSEIDVLKHFGERVRHFRKEQGYSQEKLADEAGVHRTYISGIERGERNVALKNIISISKALGVSASELLEGLNDD